ncbi:MAG: tetratricopeptide repeat protein, partial [Phycisphaerales bacterium]|nr:tetratricopeptide repeat protein [Phycisphaerales bacterium]
EQKRELDAKSRDATIQRDRAIQAESRAVARFNQIREIAESFLFEFHDAIRDLPGSTEAREFVVSRALMYLDKIAVDSKDDPELLRGLVAGYLKVGDVQGGLGFANLGDTQGALDSYERAAQLALHWSGAAPDDPAPLRALADARRRIGATLATQGDVDDALAAYRTSRSDIERLLASDPDNPQYQQDLQKVESCIGTALATAWRYDDANAAFDRALAINESLVERDPDNPTHRRDLVVVLLKQVRAAINTNQPPEGWIAKTDRSIDLLRGLNDDTSDNVTILRDLAIAYDFKAESFLKSKDLQSALTQYEENLALAKRLHELDPKNALAKNDLMVAHNNVARTLLAFERNEEAIRQFEQGLDIARALVAADRSNYDAVRNVGRSHHYVAMAKLGKEDIDGAIASATASLEAFDEVATHDPANTAVLRDIANLLGLRGDLYIGIADDEAQPADRRIEMYQKSIPDFTQFRAILIQLKDAGKLSEQEAPIIDALQAEVDRCNAAIATLKSGI